jgi:replication initiation and membrane attachment protein DnaB
LLQFVFKRNRQRFPDDFTFQLTAAEFADLKSQLATSRVQDAANPEDAANSSQIAMSSSQAVESEGSVPNWSQFVTSSYHN